MVKRVFKNVGTMIAEMKVGDRLEVRGFDIDGVYRIIGGPFDDATEAERRKSIFHYAHHRYRFESSNEANVPDLFSEIMMVTRIK